MKKLFTFLFAALVEFSTFGQISITRNDMPAAGDTFRYATVQVLGANLNLNNKGANRKWNYNSLNKNGEELLEYKRSSQTPYAFYFFNTFGNLVADDLGFGQFNLTDVYNFYRTTNTRFTAEGLGFRFNNIPLGGFYSDKDEIFQFPLNYGDRDSSTFRVVITIPTFGGYSQSGTRINEVDGWGEITTPHRTYDCIRVKSTISQVDSFRVQQPFPLSFGFPSTRVEYKWLTKDDKVPVMEANGNEVAGNFIPTQIRYRQNPVTLPPGVSVEEVKGNKVTVYPNPATDEIVVEIPNYGGNQVKLFTMEGKEVSVKYVRLEGSIEVRVDGLTDGYYMLFAKSGNEIVWEKVQVQH